MILAQQQRQALCDTALAVGPDAPTLCSPWTVKDLLAHLVIRERRPDTLPGIGVSALLGTPTRSRMSSPHETLQTSLV
ncbi:maleylpyruvate isomerase N-terminal domain-containing protein [Ornithinimicrobium sp. INDO-MA30-4]|uniref:maleylpyruvate isomerase N-terminal domain-containing protein n=1 Tax=Ornithinimicrobium sp. INDO-MA30-4 TaxID=2908651 RepID=UPI001F3E8F9B|nr:maleylpyruvate isomerase N-terminal domain-containing protein [Ornithinimicrobium sp. INDO-MA30-4]UJH71014.1 maleylpyruvate isomerase N-terminal domain-containing protein [Ornithinimicrobium sp. INDO-MA30-4]